jgi:hypothetical protein
MVHSNKKLCMEDARLEMLESKHWNIFISQLYFFKDGIFEFKFGTDGVGLCCTSNRGNCCVRDRLRRDSVSAAERIYVLTSTSILHPVCLPTARYLRCLPTFTVYLFAVHNTTLRLM